MSHNKMQDELTCPICMELFRQPRRLPCGHSYCHLCITAMLSKSAEQERSYLSFSRRLVCPECRDEVYLDFVEGIEAIPLDFKLSKLVELFQFMKKSDDSDSDGIPATSRPVKSLVTRDPSSPESTASSSSSLQRTLTPHTPPQPPARTSLVTSGGETITPQTPSQPSFEASLVISGDETISGETSATLTPAAGGSLHRTAYASPLSSQNIHDLSTDTNSSDEDPENRHVVGAENAILSHPSQTFNHPETQVENSPVPSSCISPSEQGSNQRDVTEIRDETVVDEPCEGAVGGVSSSEAPKVDLGLKNVLPHFNSSDDNINPESSRERSIQYIGSALTPSVTASIQSPSSARCLAKSTSCHSQSDIATSNSCQRSGPGHLVRAQSLPPEEIQADGGLVESKSNREGLTPQVSTSGKTKRTKTKKGRSWKSLFVGDSSSSDESSSDSDEPSSPPKPPTPRVKKRQLVTRFLKSIILSDSSSSDWSDDSDYENKNKSLRRPKIIAKDQKTTTSSTNRSLPDISPHTHNALNDTIVSSAGTAVTKGKHFEGLRNLVNSNIPESSSQAVSQHLTPSASDSSPAEVTRSLPSSTDSNTQPKEVVPANACSASITSQTIRKQTVSNEATVSTDCTSQVLQEDIVTAPGNLAKDLSKSSEKFSQRETHKDTKSEEERNEGEGRTIRDTQELKLNTFAASAHLENYAPSHYDNLDVSRHVGIAELDIDAPAHEQMNVPASPLPVDPTLYDNINSFGQSPQAARTLYDNISDSDLVQCRFETERALSQTRGLPIPEIENLKTGFEDMERSVAKTNMEENISSSRHNYTGESSPLELYGPHQPSLKRTPMPTNLLAEPSPSPPPPHGKTGPSSLYDNVSGIISSTVSPGNSPSGRQQRLSAMPFSDMPNYHPHHFADQLQTSENDFPQRQSGTGNGAPEVPENITQVPMSVTSSQTTVSTDPSADGACGDPHRSVTQTDSVTTRESSPGCGASDDNNNVNAVSARRTLEEEDDINDEETDPGARMLQPKRKPRSKLRKFITSLLSLSSSSDEDEHQYYANNTSSSSKSSDW